MPAQNHAMGLQVADEMGSITLAAMFDTQDQKMATHEALRIFLVNQLIDRLMEGKFGGRNKQMVQARKLLQALDLNQDSQLSPSERIPAIDFIRNSDFMKRFGAIGFD